MFVLDTLYLLYFNLNLSIPIPNNSQAIRIRMNISSLKLLLYWIFQLFSRLFSLLFSERNRPGDWAILKPEASRIANLNIGVCQKPSKRLICVGPVKARLHLHGKSMSQLRKKCWKKKMCTEKNRKDMQKWTFWHSNLTSQVLRWIVGEVLRLCEVSFGNDGAFLYIYCLRAGVRRKLCGNSDAVEIGLKPKNLKGVVNTLHGSNEMHLRSTPE